MTRKSLDTVGRTFSDDSELDLGEREIAEKLRELTVLMGKRSESDARGVISRVFLVGVNAPVFGLLVSAAVGEGSEDEPLAFLQRMAAAVDATITQIVDNQAQRATELATMPTDGARH